MLTRLVVTSGVSRRALAAGLGIDPSFLSKVLSGKKPCPPALPARAEAWLASQTLPGHHSADPGPPEGAGPGRLVRVQAQACLDRGWSVVPQMPGAKKPLVRWKEFQQRRPAHQEVASWFRRWPQAGLALVLGPVSGVFVIDVDGPEAHAALVARLGAEPRAPKAWSGSGKPCRYHLFFRNPAVPTRAKATPWHPQLEFRGRGGIVVIPPSLHKSGRRYAWAAGRSPDDLPFPDVPAAVLESLAPPPPTRPARAAVPTPAGLEASPSTRDFLAGRYADGPGWNERLYRAGCDLNCRGLPLEDAEPLLLAGAAPWDQSEHDAALRTIRSAYSCPREPGRS
jgi:hypothetical protein